MKKTLLITAIVLTAVLLTACSTTFNLFDKSPTPLPPAPPVETAAPIEEVEQGGFLEVTLYFMDENRFLAATEPYEVGVKREVALNADPRRTLLDLYFEGPTPEEEAAGLKLLTSGFTHVRNMTIENGIARVYLGGVCANNGAAYSVAALIFKNLEQYEEITAVKIYDENDTNLDPDSDTSSLPYCLEP